MEATDIPEPDGLIVVVWQKISILTFSEGSLTILGTALWELQSTFFLLGLGISFLRPCLSLKKVGKHKGTDWTRFSALQRFPDCIDLVSMQCTMEVALTVEEQKDKSLVFLRFDKFSEILVEGISTLNGLLSFLTANLPLYEAWKIFCSNSDPMV